MDRYTLLFLAGFGFIVFDAIMLGAAAWLAIGVALAVLIVTYGLEWLGSR